MSRNDDIRLKDILDSLLRAFEDPDLAWMTADMKLLGTFQPEKYPIVRRKIVKKYMPVTGMWWMSESQWVRFLWHGHKGKVIKTDQDPDRVYARKVFDKGWCYVRDMGSYYDIEAVSRSTKWDPNATKEQRRRRKKRYSVEWMTVSITKEEYAKLNEYLGPPTEVCCKHNQGWDDEHEH